MNRSNFIQTLEARTLFDAAPVDGLPREFESSHQPAIQMELSPVNGASPDSAGPGGTEGGTSGTNSARRRFASQTNLE
jgi:hypothetical protein